MSTLDVAKSPVLVSIQWSSRGASWGVSRSRVGAGQRLLLWGSFQIICGASGIVDLLGSPREADVRYFCDRVGSVAGIAGINLRLRWFRVAESFVFWRRYYCRLSWEARWVARTNCYRCSRYWVIWSAELKHKKRYILEMS